MLFGATALRGYQEGHVRMQVRKNELEVVEEKDDGSGGAQWFYLLGIDLDGVQQGCQCLSYIKLSRPVYECSR